MKSEISKETIENCRKTPWDFGNEVLYIMCKENFLHKESGKIIAKIWLIGRAYSAAIERRKNKVSINDNFYVDTVAPAFLNSKIDSYLSALNGQEELTMENLPHVLEAHNYLTQLTASITKLEKRSFSSKYLHFHLPNLFFIYDSRVTASIRGFSSKIPEKMRPFVESEKVDKEYAKFVCRCFELRNEINKTFNIQLTMREFDNLLIYYANRRLELKN
ncbi:MAG: hypothetical protein JXR48_12300 [Candidatus Delongbacteria bacterium]|nr:hypothetical protein [Candidatus Delongbacteria bacterium]